MSRVATKTHLHQVVSTLFQQNAFKEYDDEERDELEAFRKVTNFNVLLVTYFLLQEMYLEYCISQKECSQVGKQ